MYICCGAKKQVHIQNIQSLLNLLQFSHHLLHSKHDMNQILCSHAKVVLLKSNVEAEIVSTYIAKLVTIVQFYPLLLVQFTELTPFRAEQAFKLETSAMVDLPFPDMNKTQDINLKHLSYIYIYMKRRLQLEFKTLLSYDISSVC